METETCVLDLSAGQGRCGETPCESFRSSQAVQSWGCHFRVKKLISALAFLKRLVRLGSWSCENVSAEGDRRRQLNLACCPNCELESRWLARSAVSDLVVPMDTPMRTPQVWIAAMRGFTPRMFMARVRL